MSRQKQSHVSMRDRAEEPDTNSRHDRNVLLALTGVCVLLLAPLTLVDMPPLMDYPNHLARMYALAFSGQDPVLARFFAPHWAIIPNLALDLADRAYLIETGAVVIGGSAEKIRGDDSVRRADLGY